MTATTGRPRVAASARRAGLAAFAGIGTGLALAAAAPWRICVLAGWDVGVAVYVAWVWRTVWPLDGPATARQAVAEEPGRAATDTALLAASLASLLSVGTVLASASGQHGARQSSLVGLSVASVVLSWTVVHTLFTLRYARLYYVGPDGGVSFNQDEQPRYSDFAYLAFTVGMTFQVSDTDISDWRIRATALRHALLSYVFGAVIVALTINLVAGLSK